MYDHSFRLETTWPDLDAANVASGHYNRNGKKPDCLLLAEEVYTRTLREYVEMETLHDLGIASNHDLLLAEQAEFAAFNMRSVLTDIYWLTRSAVPAIE